MKPRQITVLIAGAAIAIASHAQSSVKGDPAKAQAIVKQACSACHGDDGNSPSPVNPNLAGQHPEYTLKQLLAFKSHGSKPAERSNAVMAGMVASLQVEDMHNLALYFGAQRPSQRTAREPSLAKLGQAIYRGGIMSKGVAACAACHAPDGAGIPAQFPRIAGQHAEYTEAQLKAFRSGERKNDPNRMMRAVAAKLSDPEIKALAEYIAGLR